MRVNCTNKAWMLLALTSCTFASCSVFRHGKKHKAPATAANIIPPSPPPLPPSGDTIQPAGTDMAASLLAEAMPLWQRRLTYNTFAGKAHIAFAGPKNSREFSANIRMKKDSVIWVTITFLGIPAARVFVTPDSLFMVNYVQKEASRIPLKASAKFLPTEVDFTTLQNLIVGDPLRGGQMVKALHDEQHWNLFAADDAYQQQLTYTNTDTSLVTYSLATTAPNGPQATVHSNKFDVITGRRMPVQRNIAIRNGADNYTVDMDIQSAAFDVEQEYPFSIPKNYSIK